MIRISLTTAACCLALAACGTPLEEEGASACTSMLAGDPEIEEDLAEDGDTVEVYCGCFGTLLPAQPEEAQAQILEVAQAIAGIRDEADLGLEEAAGRIDDDFDSAGASAAYGVSRDAFDTTGKYVDTVRRALSDETSACRAGQEPS